MLAVIDESGMICIVNLAARAASRMNSPISVESDHSNWRAYWADSEGLLLKDTDGPLSVVRGTEERISRPTCDKGWEGCSRNTVGIGELFSPLRPKGRINLKRCEVVGRSFPVGQS